METSFTLKKLTVETLGVSCQYENQITKDDETIDTEVCQKKDSRPPHLDLTKLFSTGLAKVIVKILHLDQIPGYTESSLHSVCPTTIRLSGKGEDLGVVISGYLIIGVIGKLSFKTPKIKFLSGSTDVHADLTVLIPDIEREIQKYLFEGKIGDVEEFGND